eukprot:1849_1
MTSALDLTQRPSVASRLAFLANVDHNTNNENNQEYTSANQTRDQDLVKRASVDLLLNSLIHPSERQFHRGCYSQLPIRSTTQVFGVRLLRFGTKLRCHCVELIAQI